ncbi:Tol-Pal system protein TolQ [Alphaproteobacteria bacterium SO-S41]|nr:Tol-Pal system protein TolQ [Alphaproteobacteria bacterium SO-S41]
MTDVRFASRLVRGFAAGAIFVGLTVASPAVLAQTTPAPATPPAAAPATPAPGTPPAAAPAGAPPAAAPGAAPAVGPDGLPVAGPAPAAAPGAAPAVIGPDGLPVAGPAPAPAPAPMQPKLGPDGKPVLGPDGQPIMEPAPAPAPVAAPPAAPEAPKPPPPKKPIEANFFGIPVLIPAEDEYSLYGLFMIAHPVVKVVMIGLFICSVISWAILISKLIYLGGLNRRTTNFLNEFRSSNAPLQDLSKSISGKDRSTPPAQMVEAAANEIDLTFAQGPASTGEKRDHLTQRIGSAMSIAQASRSAELGSGMAFLATVGSIATFVGLFGTVWGIMYSFIGIAQSKSTNLAVVAPGIAEALLATAIGLFAAIPAVVFYNVFARRIAAYNQRLDTFSSELLVRVSRQLDQSAG